MLRSFINRKTELEALNKAYHSTRAELFIIYGRRRIGKTELIKEFAKDKTHFYHLARRQSLTLEREELSRRFAEKFNIHLPIVNSFEATFKIILEKIPKTEKLIIIIDEFPYWVAEDENILSEFQHLWDELLQNSSIFLILCGSYLSLMEEKVLGIKSPLYGRRTGQLKIEPLPVNTLKYFVPKYDLEEIIKVYGSLGGVPFYLKEVDDTLSFFENIRNTFLNKSNILNKEAEFLLREELREVNVYFNILRAITEGATTISEIAAKSRVDISNIHKYLAILQGLALIKKIKPLNAPVKEKRYLYQVEDNYFRFWMRYVYPYQSELEEDPALVMKIIEQSFSTYMGYVFEDFSQKILKLLPLKMVKAGLELGKWWCKDKEIDIIGINRTEKEVIFVECKWKEKVKVEEIFRELEEKSQFVEGLEKYSKKHYLVLAKSFERKPAVKKENKKFYYAFDLKDIEKAL